MKKNLLLSLLAACCIITGANAQIVGPGTALPGSVTFSATPGAFTYHWDFTSSVVSLTPFPFTPPPVFLGAGTFNVPSFTCFVQDQSLNSYYFVSEYNTGNLWCYKYGYLDFPLGPHSTVLIGNFSGYGTQLEGIDVVQDDANNWVGLAVNTSNLIQINFGSGSSLNIATPTINVLPEPFYWPHQITIKQFDPGSGGGWHAFVADRNGTIDRLDFPGTGIFSLMNPPTFTSLPNVGGVTNPCNFTLYNQPLSKPNPGWYMLVPSLISANVSLYSFGSSLMSVPTGTMEPTPSPNTKVTIHLPRQINIFPDCTGQLFALLFNETGYLNEISFPGGDITASPTYIPVGSTGSASLGSGATCAFQNGPNGINSFCYLLPDFSSGAINMFNPFLQLLPNAYCDYALGTQSNTFTSNNCGLNDISCFLDMGRPSGPSVLCSQININCEQTPCYNPQQTNLTISPSASDPCAFTACVNVSTGNAVTGYTWDVEPGGLIVNDPSPLTTDCFTFGIAPGTVYTVTVTVHISDQNMNCCEAVLTQTIQCGNAAGDGSGNPDSRMSNPNGTPGVGSDILVYPNPTNSVISISTTNTLMNTIQVFNVMGQKVGDYSYNAATSADISLGNLPTGTYILRINNAISKIVNKTE